MVKSEYGEAVIKWITITILIAVSIFFVFLYNNVMSQDNPEVQTEIPPVGELENEDNNEEENNNDDDEEVIPQIEFNTFPREAFTNNQGEYYINTGGSDSEKLMNVIDISGYYYLIIETNSNGYDYNADRYSVAVSKLDYNGTLIATVTLNANRNEYYLESKVTNNGILVATYGTSGVTYNLISLDLEHSKAVTNDAYSTMKMFYTRDYTLIAGIDNNNLHISAICSSLNTLFSNVIEFESAVTIVDIFPSRYGYSVIINDEATPMSYIVNINNNGDLLSKSIISNNLLLKITPIASGYALLERRGQSLFLRTINLSLAEQFSTLIGEGDSGDFYPVHNGYVTFCNKASGTISKHLSSNGEIITINSLDYMDIISIKSTYSTDNGIFFYADVINNNGTRDTKIINYSKNNMATYYSIIAGSMNDNANTIIIKDNYAIAFLTTKSYNNDFINNYGDSDIFIISKRLN